MLLQNQITAMFWSHAMITGRATHTGISRSALNPENGNALWRAMADAQSRFFSADENRCASLEIVDGDM